MRKRSRPLSYSARRVRSATSTLLRQLGLEAVGAYHKQNGLCFWCKEPWGRGAEVDHHLPVSKGGKEGIDNLRVLCNQCNRAKSTRHPEEFLQHRRAQELFADSVQRVKKSRPSPIDTRRQVVFDSQNGTCRWCPSPLVGAWALSRSLSGSCSECEIRYRGLSDAQIQDVYDLI